MTITIRHLKNDGIVPGSRPARKDLGNTNHPCLDVSSAEWASGLIFGSGSSLPLIRAFQASVVSAIRQSNEVVVLEPLEADGAVRFIGDIHHVHVFKILNSQLAMVVLVVDSDVVVSILEKLTGHVADCDRLHSGQLGHFGRFVFYSVTSSCVYR